MTFLTFSVPPLFHTHTHGILPTNKPCKMHPRTITHIDTLATEGEGRGGNGEC